MDLDSSVVGITGEVFVADVEARHIRQFADAIGDKNPLYWDMEYARKSTFGTIIAPPTFAIALTGDAGELPIKLDERRMLHGEQEFIYHRPIRLGERLYCQRKISDLYERQGKSGKMQFLVIDTEIKDKDGDMVAVSRMNIIYRPLKTGVK